MPISRKAIAQRQKTFAALKTLHPNAWSELNFKNPLQLLVAVILSAQANDKTVNSVTIELFKKYKTAKDYASVPLKKLDNDIKRINFHTNKAKSIQGAAKMLLEQYNGKIPDTMEELIKLPGVGRKTANVILGHVFNKSEGVVVDTHVIRVANRLGWTKNTDPAKIEADLMKLFPSSQWRELADVLVLHGRYICTARSPKCENEKIYEPFCPAKVGKSQITSTKSQTNYNDQN